MINLKPTQLTIKDSDRCFVLLKLTATDRHKGSRGLSATTELLVTLPPVLCRLTRDITFSTGPFVPFVLSSLISLEHDILKTNKQILLQTGASGPRETIDFGARRSKVKVTAGWRFGLVVTRWLRST